MQARPASKTCKQEMQARHLSKACKQVLQARHASKACKQGMQARHASKACKQGMQANNAAKQWIILKLMHYLLQNSINKTVHFLANRVKFLESSFESTYLDSSRVLDSRRSVYLQRIHSACVWWMSRHDMIFIFEKYELIHLSCRTKGFNMRATMKINDVVIQPKIDIKVLKL